MYLCVCVCVSMCQCKQEQAIAGMVLIKWMATLDVYPHFPAWDMVSGFAIAYTRLAGLWASGNSPISTSNLM